MTKCINVSQELHDLKDRVEALEKVLRVWRMSKAPDPTPAPAPKDFKCALAKEMLARFEKQGQFETEGFGFAQELVSQYGGDYIDDDATIFKISAKDLYVLMRVIGYGQDPSALDELRTLLDAAEEALVSAQKMIDVALPKFNWGASFLNAEAIQLLNETPREVTEALRRIGELKVEQSRVQN